MEVIEKKVHEHFARQAENAQATSSLPTSLTNSIPQAEDDRPVEISIQGVRPGQTQVLEEPFAKVNSVVDGSPAHEAGLKPGDLLRNFGGVGKREGMGRVGEVVAESEGVGASFFLCVSLRLRSFADVAIAAYCGQSFKRYRVGCERAGAEVDA
jgi:26S proteasome non-ATPase regulatory subunit 9